MSRTVRALALATLVLTLAGVVPFWADAQSNANAPSRTLSIATLAPAGSTWMRVFDAWNRELRRRSSGRLQFRFYPNGVQGDEAEIVRKIRNGRLDGGALTAVGLSQIHRPTLAFQIPGMFRTYAQLDRARDALRPELDTAYRAAGFELLGWGDVGTDRVFSDRAVRTPADFARTHCFLWRDDMVSPALFDETHARPVTLQVPEVLTALQLHQLDTVIASPLGVASLQWAPSFTHMTDLPMAVEVGAIVVGHAQVAALPADLQQLLRETGAQFSALMVRNVRHDDDGAIGPMQQRGVAQDALTPAEQAQWQAVFRGVRTRLTGTVADAAWIARVQQLAGP